MAGGTKTEYGMGRHTGAAAAVVDDPMLTFGADVVESERLSRLRQSRILRFQIRWMETLAEHARRQLTVLDAEAAEAPPTPEDLERAAREQATVTGEIPQPAKRTRAAKGTHGAKTPRETSSERNGRDAGVRGREDSNENDGEGSIGGES